MNQKFKKFLKRTAIVTTGVVAFGGTLVGGYLLTPNRTSLIDVSVKERELTPFERFVQKVTRDIGFVETPEGEEKVESYLSASFDNFQISYSVNDSQKVNTVGIEGGVDFRMTALSLNKIEFSVNAHANYNGKTISLTLGHFHNDIYLGIYDPNDLEHKSMKIKFSNFNESSLVDHYWYTLAMYAGIDAGKLLEGLGGAIGGTLNDLIDGLLNSSDEDSASEAKSEEEGGLDIMGLISRGPKSEKKGDGWSFTIGGEKDDPIAITLITDADYSLKRVDLGTLSFGGVTVSGAINVELKPYNTFISPANGNDYVEVFNYAGLTQKFATLLKEDGQHQRVGFEFEADLDQQLKKSKVDIAKIEGSVNIDFDRLLDLSQYSVAHEDEVNGLKRNETPASESELYSKIKEAGFNLQLNILGQNDVEYANLALVFADGQGYLNFNEQEDKSSVMKLKVDTETMNWVVDKIPELIDSLSSGTETNTMDTLEKFLSEDMMESINDGDFSFILDMIKVLKNSEDGFELGIDISSLGIGEEAYVGLKINNDTNVVDLDELKHEFPENPTQEEIDYYQSIFDQENNSDIELEVRNLVMGDFTLDASLRSASYKDVVVVDEEYQSVRFLPDVIDQISEYAQSKQTGFKIYGEMKNEQGIGIDFDGVGQLDNNEEVKQGYGTMTINEYKYRGDERWAQHLLAVDVLNLESNVEKDTDEDGNEIRFNNNEALFVYGDPAGDNIKGKMKLQTFADIFDIISTFIDESGDDPKYTKFLAPITELLGMSAIGEILENKDYMQLASNKLLKKVEIVDDGGAIHVVVAKDLIGLPSDIDITVNLNGNNSCGFHSGEQTLKSLEVKGLKLSDAEDAKELNFTFELQDYDPEMNTVISREDTSKYMSLDGIKLLLDMGINTTKLNYWHLTASASVDTILGINLPLDGIDFYIYVDGERVKVYGTIADIPTIPVITIDDDDEILTGEKLMSVEFSFETYADNTDNKVGGIFNLRRVLKDETFRTYSNWTFPFVHQDYYYDCISYHYRSDSQNFLDNIITYLMSGLLGIRENYVKKIITSDTSTSSERPAGNFVNTFTSTGFKSSTTGEGVKTVHTIQLGLNLNELTGISALKELEATITSRRKTYTGNTDGIDIISTLNASLRINYGVDINVTFSAAVESCEFTAAASLAAWNNNASSAFNALTTVVIADQYYNDPNNPYKRTYTEDIPD